MSNQQSPYRQIMKATSIFGGVQVFNIIISIVRSKFVAILLGTTGMGVMGLLTSTTGMISSLTNLGLGTSAVKDIASAYSTGDEKRIGIVVSVFRRLVWITGLIGLVVTAIFSPWLSQLTFGNKDYSLAFIWLSITLLLNQLSNGQLVVLQGLRKLNYLAKANLSGSFIGLFITLPLYYFFGLDGIIPGIIGTALLSLLMSWYFSGKIIIEKTVISRSQTIFEGGNMLRMGIMISTSGLFALVVAYIIRIFISRTGGLEQVGLYNAGFSIINTYISLIFNAMGTDFYPRLSEVSHDNKLCKQTINQQAEIALLIMAPILIIFITYINYAIILLYSTQFVPVNNMLHWAALGMFFKASSWAIAFIFLAKGTSKLFFWNELIANLYSMTFGIIGYHLGGLNGLGFSFVITYLLYLIQIYLVSNKKFEFTFDRSFVNIFFIQFGFSVIAFLIIRFLYEPYTYVFSSIFIIFSIWFSARELEKRIGLLNILINYIRR